MTKNAGNGLETLWATKNPLNISVVSSGNGNPTPPKTRRTKIPK
jgi:hypothetical protein